MTINSVTRLSFSYRNITNIHIASLNGFPSLKSLEFSHVHIATATNFKMLPEGLEKLSFDRCHGLTDANIGELHHLKMLRSLSIVESFGNITGINFDLLPTSLVELVFGKRLPSSSKIADEHISRLQHLANLELLVFDIGDLDNISSRAMLRAIRSLRHDLTGLKVLTDYNRYKYDNEQQWYDDDDDEQLMAAAAMVM